MYGRPLRQDLTLSPGLPVISNGPTGLLVDYEGLPHTPRQ